MASISTERAATGERSLKVEDPRPSEGSNVRSALMPARAPRTYELRGKAFGVSGDGLGVHMRYLDQQGRLLNETNEKGWIAPILTLGGAEGRWRRFSQTFEVPRGATHLRVWINSFSSAGVEAFLDDLALEPAQR